MDFKDLAYQTVGTLSYPLVPHSVYQRQLKCVERQEDCKTIYQDYEPVIIFRIQPGILSSIDPAWSRCGYELQTAHDPPVVMSAVQDGDDPEPAIPALPSISTAQPGTAPASIPLETMTSEAPRFLAMRWLSFTMMTYLSLLLLHV
jgi:hypothetical protein